MDDMLLNIDKFELSLKWNEFFSEETARTSPIIAEETEGKSYNAARMIF